MDYEKMKRQIVTIKGIIESWESEIDEKLKIVKPKAQESMDDEILRAINDISSRPNLSDWNRTFISSINTQYRSYGKISDKQRQKLAEIYRRT